MSAMICHESQSCYESQLLESRTSTALRLTFKPKCYSEEVSCKTDEGGWSFLQALSNVSHGDLLEPSEKESVYVHPQAKRSSLILSEKSLQLCTENLGNETGTDIVVGNSIDLLCSSSERDSAGDSPTREQTKAARSPVFGGNNKREKTQNFPPPLTTMRGSESLRVRPHREDGRLVIEAVRVTSTASCFKAERSHGRLRLHLLKNESTSFDYEDDDADEKEGVESEMKEEDDEDEEEEVEEEEEEDERDGERGGLRGYDWPSRCRGEECDNNEMFILEHLWVTST